MNAFGIDIIHSEGVGRKAWARLKSQKVMDVSFLVTILEAMKLSGPNPDIDVTNGDNDVEVEPGSSTFYYERCALQVDDALESGEVDCTVLRSSNVNYPVGSCVQLYDTEIVKECVLNTFNSELFKCL